jgi:hypothetical protein
VNPSCNGTIIGRQGKVELKAGGLTLVRLAGVGTGGRRSVWSIQRMGTVMAGKGSDFKAHERTYEGFTALFKWGAVASFVLAFIVVLLIAG